MEEVTFSQVITIGDVMDSTLMHINKGKTGEDTNGAYLST